MTKLQKTQQILNLIVSMAGAIVTLSEIWNKISPQVKKIVIPVIDDCKKLIDETKNEDEEDFEKEIKTIVNQN